MNPGEYQGLNINIILNTIIPSSILKKRYLTVEHSTHESIDANLIQIMHIQEKGEMPLIAL